MSEVLQKAFEEFQVRAEKLSQAYEAMQADFKNVNLELDRKNAELALSLRSQQEMQTYLNSILESMHNGVIGIDTSGKITQFNRAASEITGYATGEVVHGDYRNIFAAKPDQALSLLDTLEKGKEHKRDEKVIWHKDGHPVPVSMQTALLKDVDGALLGAVEIFSDISRIKAMEQEMQRTKRLAVLGEMAATVAHEIRNPLGAMGVWAGLLERDLEPEDQRRKTVNRITEGLGRLNRIVSNLLVYSRPIRASLREVDLALLLDEIIDFVQIEVERLGQDVAIVKAWDKASPAVVMADPEKLQQVVMNLCLNAVQAMHDGGALTVGLERSTREFADYTHFSIADTGSGIEKEKLEKIFDPFFTTKENGTGLGLAIVKKIIEFHSGFIRIHSDVGNGTAVSVFLPGKNA
ncbi:MAG: PAS domain S-box protein [Chitinivibrionales bacterium]|nr:PAS domain S-box protein [Chitinivibrionales bacterium]